MVFGIRCSAVENLERGLQSALSPKGVDDKPPAQRSKGCRFQSAERQYQSGTNGSGWFTNPKCVDQAQKIIFCFVFLKNKSKRIRQEIGEWEIGDWEIRGLGDWKVGKKNEAL